MGKLIVLLGLAAVACGSNAGSSAPVSGTVGGTSFSPTEIVAATAGPALCPVSGLSLEVAAVAIRFATFNGSCADLTAATCTSHRSSRSATLIVAKAATSAASAAVAPATYTVVADPGSFSLGLGGAAELAIGNSTTTDDQCADTTSAATGSLRLDQVSGALVSGHVDVSFADGGKLQGDFIASTCPFGPDACTIAASRAICSGTPVCR